MSDSVTIFECDVLDGLARIEAGSVHCCVTSPPYWGLRDYGVEGQIGLEETPEAFIEKMVAVFAGVHRVLRDDGTLWLNIGDSYNAYNGNRGTESKYAGDRPMMEPSFPSGHGLMTKALKPKDLCMMPWRVALALQADGWWLRSVICWAKKSPMPESVTDRPTSSWEPIFLMSKSAKYFYDAEAVRMPASGITGGPVIGGVRKGAALREQGIRVAGREMTVEDRERYMTSGANMRNVWHLGPEPYAEAHFATFPTEIPRRAIKAGTSEKGCCAVCGAPSVRQTEDRGYVKHRPSAGDDPRSRGEDKHAKANGTTGWQGNNLLKVPPRTVGWKPGCECGAATVPCLVLDPFLGSGTTVAVARELGRHGVGIELNPAYAKLARKRIGKAERPSTFRDMDKEDDAPLFMMG